MKFLTTIILVLATSYSCYSQDLTIELTDKIGKNNVFNQNTPVFPVTNVKLYKGFDTISYNIWSIRSFVLNTTQYVYEITPSRKGFIDYALKYGLDTVHLFNGKIERNSVGVFVAIDKKGFKHVIVDLNNNRDFSDDKEFIYDLNKIEEMPILNIEFDVLVKKKLKPKKFPFLLDVYSNHTGAKGNDALQQINMINQSYREGYINIGQRKYRIQISDQYRNTYPNYPYFINITNVPIDPNSNNYYRFNNNEQLFFDNDLYSIKNIDTNKITISFLKKVEYNGAKQGTYAPNFGLKDFIKKDTYTLKQNRGKYILIDFWGSWCVPCLENIPKLVEAKKKLQNKNIQFVSIAYDNLKDTTILKKIIHEKKMEWTNLLIPKNNKIASTILKNYQIQVYPTFLIIDQKGKVIYRGKGEEGVAMGLEFVNNIKFK